MCLWSTYCQLIRTDGGSVWTKDGSFGFRPFPFWEDAKPENSLKEWWAR